MYLVQVLVELHAVVHVRAKDIDIVAETDDVVDKHLESVDQFLGGARLDACRHLGIRILQQQTKLHHTVRLRRMKGT